MSTAEGAQVRLHPDDDVAVIVDPAAKLVGHKVAVRAIGQGAAVRKYGHIIGWAKRPIVPGEHVHTHNLSYGDHRASAPEAPGQAPAAEPSAATFAGIRRSDGRVATRNTIGVLATVNCSATACHTIATRAAMTLPPGSGIDAVVPITHSSGCGLSHDGENLARLRRTLGGLAAHPNLGALVVVALGCEVNQIRELLDEAPLRPGLPVRELVLQELGGTRATVELGVSAVLELARQVGPAPRTPVGLDELVLGLNCGGSDGWSGITANPALGVASDRIVASGGRSVLAETPEIYGAESLLLERAGDPEVAARLRRIIEAWERGATATGESLDNNPSPGNRKGGLTTILEKSLGAVAKGGHAPLSAVYEYAQRIDVPGFGFMDTPGYDPVSVTGLIAGGANVVVFTTGRGSALGYGLVPVIKVATNTALFERMRDDMDLNAGDIIDAGVSVNTKGEQILRRIVEVASGARTRSEDLGYGAHEFVPWLTGTVF